MPMCMWLAPGVGWWNDGAFLPENHVFGRVGFPVWRQPGPAGPAASIFGLVFLCLHRRNPRLMERPPSPSVHTGNGQTRTGTMNDTTCHESGSQLAHDPHNYLRYVARARRLQSEAIGRGLGAAGRFLARTAADAYRRGEGRVAETADDSRAIAARRPCARRHRHRSRADPHDRAGPDRSERRSAAADRSRCTVPARAPRPRRERYGAAVGRRLRRRRGQWFGKGRRFPGYPSLLPDRGPPAHVPTPRTCAGPAHSPLLRPSQGAAT